MPVHGVGRKGGRKVRPTIYGPGLSYTLARVLLRRFLFLLAPLSPSSFGGFLGYRGPLFGREFFGAGLPAPTPAEFP